MKLKTFRTHTRAMIQDIVDIELSFNVWASDNKDTITEILRTDYFVQKRIDAKYPELYYEELVLLVFYK
jgi:hypothetical protein